MTEVAQQAGMVAAATADDVRADTAPSPKRPPLADTWWRHLIGLAACVVALFPVVYVASAAFSRDATLSGASAIPSHITLHNFGLLFHDKSNPFLRWLLNSMIVAVSTALLTVLLGALASYAFSRFRFKGRRIGMLFLLLVQMFPQLLAVVAIYLIVLHVGDVFSGIGLNTLSGLIIVYLGGVLGVNTWLMKGFFDTIPPELDESARVDGATPAQVFWGVVLPLAAPVLAVIALFSFIFTLNEFVVASVILQSPSSHYTLPLGMRVFIDQQYDQHWGPFAAGVLIAGIPVMILFMFLQRFIVSGLTQGSVKG
ncbi:MAG: arabinogalactan oligomer / maltooligosaccharide transport system permease protein [Gaiellaceae bacterium]|nr:arabinogalactan oligomer / maltooligosaccharide transport system permease protein [Gaiellaceae bacterium]